MQILHIRKKRKGEFRTIYSPNDAEKAEFRALLPELQAIAARECGACVHGFMPCRSPVTNALAHKGLRFTLGFDLSDFFDTVSETHLHGKIPADLLTKVLIGGAPRQGLPTSPTVANIAATGLDYSVQAWIAASGHEIVYTRYADDLAFSFAHWHVYEQLRAAIPPLIEEAGFALNAKKTRLQDANFGRRVITGVSVGYFNVAAPREIRRKMRAAEHAGKKSALRGLTEWAKMRLPYKPVEHTVRVLRAIWQVQRGKMAVTNYPAMRQWDHELVAVAKIKDRDGIASYIRHGLRGKFDRDTIKHTDALVRSL